ncbi:hypothetical protein P7C70_g3600, partial [Phenoliferia sp. Uapishka_3]
MPSLPATQSHITLINRPKAAINPDLSGGGTFKLDSHVPLSEKEVGSDQVMIKVEWLSLDPAMRGWLNDSRSYVPPVKIDEVMRSGGVGTVAVVGKDVKGLQVGDWVTGMLGA